MRMVSRLALRVLTLFILFLVGFLSVTGQVSIPEDFVAAPRSKDSVVSPVPPNSVEAVKSANTTNLSDGLSEPKIAIKSEKLSPKSVTTISSQPMLQPSSPASSTAQSISIASATAPVTNTTAMRTIAAKYSIEVSITPSRPNLPGIATWQLVGATDISNLEAMSKLLSTEWNKYTTNFVKASGIKGIYLVKSLNVNGQNRAAMPDNIYDNYLYFSIDSQYINSPGYLQNVIHHEFNHIIEYNVFGSWSWDDAAWKACNNTGFTYGAGGAAAYSNPNFANTYHVINGFLTGYGTYGIEEDKAEVFAEIMSNQTRLKALELIDTNFACKAKLYRAYIAQIDPSQRY
jgi:hypothetical protein